MRIPHFEDGPFGNGDSGVIRGDGARFFQLLRTCGSVSDWTFNHARGSSAEKGIIQFQIALNTIVHKTASIMLCFRD